MKNEWIWTDIPGFEGIYQVCNKGFVKSLDRTVVKAEGAKHKQKGKLLTPFKRNKNSDIYKLYNQNKVMFFKINKKNEEKNN